MEPISVVRLSDRWLYFYMNKEIYEYNRGLYTEGTMVWNYWNDLTTKE